MTHCASDLAEQFLPQLNGFAIWARRRLYRNRQRFLKYTRCCDVADKQFVYYAVTIRIAVPTETFDGLHTMMLTEGINTKLPNRAHRPLREKGLIIRSGSTPATALVSTEPSGCAVSEPNCTPFVTSYTVTSEPEEPAWLIACDLSASSSRVISRPRSSIAPEPNMPSVFRSSHV